MHKAGPGGLFNTFAAASLDRVFPGPLAGGRLVPRAVGLVDVCNFGHERVVGVGVCEHRADGEEDCTP